MPETNVAIRLGTTGKADVINDFRDIRQAGTQAMERIGNAANEAGQAGETAAARQVAAWKRQAEAASAAARAASANAGFNAILGVRDFDARESDSRRRSIEAAFDEADALNVVTGAYALNRTQRVIAQASVLNFAQQVASGTPIMRAFVQQSQDVATVLAADEGGIAGGLAKARAAIPPLAGALAGLTAIVGVGAAAWLSYESAVNQFERLTVGSGRALGLTGQQLYDIADAAADASRLTSAAAREILLGYVQAGGIGRDVLQDLIGLTRDFAAATGREAKDAIGDLATAFANPVKGAEDLARRYGLLDQAQIAQVRSLVEANDKFGAQRALLDQLAPKLAGAADNTTAAAGAWEMLKDKIGGANLALGRFIADLATTTDDERIARLEADKRFTNFLGFDTPGLDAQIAFLKRQRDARRQEVIDRGRDAQANIDAQAKAEETQSKAERMARERAAEAKRLADQAERDRQQELRRRASFVASLQGVISAELRAEDERAARLVQRLEDDQAAGRRRIAALRDAGEFAGDGSAAARLELARRAALRDAAADPDLNSRQIADRVALAVAEEQAQIDRERADLVAQINSGQARYVDLVTLANQLARVGIDLGSEQGQAIRRQVLEQDRLRQGLEEQQQIGMRTLETVLNPNNWRDWGSTGRAILNDLAQDFVRLAALNPLKNLLFGSNLPSLFGPGVIPGFAMGTPYFGGGAAWVGENGPERVILPRGSQIETNGAVRRMLGAGGAAGAGPLFVFDNRGAVMTQDLIDQMNRQAQAAAAQGAAGGAMLARADMARRQRRVIR